jgi:uncharacterized protein
VNLPPRRFLRNILIFAALCVAGCGMKTDFYREVEQNVAARNYAVAIDRLEKNEEHFGEKNEVLFNVEMGSLTHYAARYGESNQRFLAAERRMEELYTRSVSTEAAAMILNDNLIPYEGEDFEKVIVNLYLALNFAQMGDVEAALVEARKVDLKLNQYSREYEGKNVYKQDAFVRYVMGVLYEAAGETNDAFISYRKAYDGYKEYASQFKTPCPSFLKNDLVRLAGLLGFDDERRRFERDFGLRYSKPKKTESAFFLVIHSGRGPIKEESKLKVTIPDADAVLHTFVAAVPKFTPRERTQTRYDVSIQGTGPNAMRIQAELGEYITEIAKRSLQDRMTMIYLKAGGRALLKFLASEKAKSEWKKEGDGLGNFFKSLAVDIAVDASEEADVRTWRTLPNQMFVVRAQLPPGTYSVNLTGSNPTRDLGVQQITTRPGKVEFRVLADVN